MRSLDRLHRVPRWSSAAIVVLGCLAAWAPAGAQNAQLKLVSTAWPPFTNPPKQPRFALDLVETALGRIGVTAKTAIVSAPQYTPSLLSGLLDGSAAAWKDPDRERELIFSQPYLENRLVLVARHGADVAAKTMADLKGKRVAIVEGYSYGQTIDTAGPVWVRSRSEEDSLTQLLKSAVDYTLMDELVVNYIVSNYPKESDAKLEIGTTPLVTRGLHLALKRTRADAESIIERFNAQLRGMIADRTYHRMLHVDWIEADVNGDGVPELVPRTDRAGSSEPLHVYTLFAPPASPSDTAVKPGFYVGGNVYADWASVPENYKVSNSDKPDPRRSTGTVFRFVW
jgi:ABC-type amino acid transport substrate-binding protein